MKLLILHLTLLLLLECYSCVNCPEVTAEMADCGTGSKSCFKRYTLLYANEIVIRGCTTECPETDDFSHYTSSICCGESGCNGADRPTKSIPIVFIVYLLTIIHY